MSELTSSSSWKSCIPGSPSSLHPPRPPETDPEHPRPHKAPCRTPRHLRPRQLALRRRHAPAPLLRRALREHPRLHRRRASASPNTETIFLGCGALHLYGPHLAEVRSIVVKPEFRGLGAGDDFPAKPSSPKPKSTTGPCPSASSRASRTFFDHSRLPRRRPRRHARQDLQRLPDLPAPLRLR